MLAARRMMVASGGTVTAAVGFVAAANAASNGSTASTTLASWSVGSDDLILIAVCCNTSSTPATPSGYSVLLGPTTLTTPETFTLIVFSKNAVSGDSGAGVSSGLGSAVNWAMQYRIYSNVVNGVDASAIQTNATSATVNYPSLAPTILNDTEAWFMGYCTSNGSETYVQPASLGNRRSGNAIFSPYTGLACGDATLTGATENNDTGSITNYGGSSRTITAKIALA